MKKKIYIWCCDKTTDSGEGILANKFIEDLKNYNKEFNIEIKGPNKKNIIFLRKFFGSIIDRLFFPYLGIFYLWSIYIFKKNKTLCYVNYLPLWNFMIFLFIPPGTVLGPITGGSKFLKRPILNYIIRSYVFNIFYKISILILNIRKKKLLFSTNLLKDKINKKNKNHFFNYVLKDLKISKYKNKKKYDLIFYLRKHNNKNTNLQITLAKELAKKFKIITVGEKIYHHNIKNIGYATRFKLLKYIKETKFSFLSPENLYSLFAIDCISSKTNIFFQKHSLYKSKIISGVIYLNYKNVENLLKNIEKNIKEINSFRIKINSDKVKFKNYFKL